MWRWGQRTVRDVGGVAHASLIYGAHYNLRELAGSGGYSAHSASTNASAVSAPLTPRSSLRCARPYVTTPSEQLGAHASEPSHDAPSTVDVHTNHYHGVTIPVQHLTLPGSQSSNGQTIPHSPSKTVAGAEAPAHGSYPPEACAPSDDTSSSLDKLRLLLTLGLRQTSTHDIDINHIRCLYLSLRQRESLVRLHPQEYSSLISLFGSFSLSSPGRPYRSVYSHSLIYRMSAAYVGSYWDMVGLVAKDKRDYGLADMSPSDRYWLMRMDAEALKVPAVDERGHSSPERRLRRIDINYYHILRQPSVEIHVAYLEAMFASQVDSWIQTATNRLCRLITWYHGCPPALTGLLWRLALQPPSAAQGNFKAHILNAIWCRLISPSHESTGGRSAAVAASASTRTITSQSSDGGPVHSAEPTNATHLMPILRSAIFERPPNQTEPPTFGTDSYSWALSVARKVFSPDHLDENSIEHRWSCFALLAAASSPAAPVGASDTQSFAPWAAVVDWRTICTLAYLHGSLRSKECPLSVPFPDAVVERLSAMLGMLWEQWVGLPALDHAVRPRVITRAICVSFMHMSGRLRNRRVVDACRRFCAERDLWKKEGSASMGLRSLVQEQLTALLLSGLDPELAIDAALECTRDEELLSTAFSTVVAAFARGDAGIALEVQRIAHRVGIQLSTESSVEVAVYQARQGDMKSALACLSGAELSSEQRLRILCGVVNQLVWRGHRFRSIHLTRDVVDSLVAHFATTYSYARVSSDLASLLLMMPRHQYAKAAAALIEAIAQADSTSLPPTFFDRLIWNLIRHRQFRVAERMHCLAQRLHGKTAFSFERLSAKLSKYGASTLAGKLVGPSAKESEMMLVLRAVQFRELSPSPVHTLKLSRLLDSRHRHHVRSASASHRALEILIRARRLRTVKRLYGELRATQAPSSRTALGNSILHASTQRSSRSQMDRGRRALTLLRELMEKYAFVPDRVTVNTLVKAYMQWTAGVTHEQLRALFDHFVRVGYPTGGVVAHGEVPFGTAEGPPPVYLPEMDSPLSFEKHVRPLYKMFIKAFYRRGDIGAVRMVVRILKAVEAEVVDTRLVRAVNIRKGRQWLGVE